MPFLLFPREIDGLTSIVNQLNWRGDNKIAHLTGATPMLPPEQLKGDSGIQTLKDSFKDFSVQSVLPKKNVSYYLISLLCLAYFNTNIV